MNKTIQHLKDIAPMPTKRTNVTDDILKEDAIMSNATVNNATVNTNKEDNTMNKINTNISTGKATEGQFAISYQRDGYGALIPIIDGVPHKELMMGYVSEKDAQAGLELLGKVLKATNGDIPAAMRYMYTAASIAAADIKPDETIEINGTEYLIDYDKRELYYQDNKVVDLSDMQCELPREAVKAILTERLQRVLAEMEAEAVNYDAYADEEETLDGWS